MKGQLKIKIFAAQCALVVGMMGAASVAIGAPTYSSANIDWSTLSWSGGSINWIGGGGYDEGGVGIWQNGSLISSDYEAGSNANVSVTNGLNLYAKGVANANKTKSQVSVESAGDASSAFAGREASFLVGADTAITFTVDYELFADVGNNSGMADSTVYFDLWNFNSGDATWDDDFVDQVVFGSAGPVNGTFSLTMNFLAGETGIISGGAWSNAVNVSEPGVLPLLGLGLLGVWGASRRRSA